ncbi:MAG: hypothetical protein NZ750_07825 [Anaerolineae bacterium]|nr:hypothetical protein [Anaerolineae bacterium]MDW8172258.1 hypothetical protein [Anaerolineae bacterium]
MSGVRYAFIEAMLKQLPPSASTLRLLDVGGLCGPVLARQRPDIQAQAVSLIATHWQEAPASAAAVVGCDLYLSHALLRAAHNALRPGGRLIVVQPLETMDAHERYAERLTQAGFVRLLIEPALNRAGLLLRGEKPHTTGDTLARVRQTADADADALDLSGYRGRYLHLLVQQTPNKPAWRLSPDEPLRWRALAFQAEDGLRLLAFTSLPKAVAFLQAGVLAGRVRDVNKVAKFPREAAQSWPVLALNLPPEALPDAPAWLDVDPNQAAVPDE